ncbi:MAG: hypothetical protein RSH52_10330, partial [Janthinobacterium sp.]
GHAAAYIHGLLAGEANIGFVQLALYLRRGPLHCEVDDPLDTSGVEAIIASIRELTKLRGEVVLVAVGSLAQDGKVIDDMRDYK